MSFTILTCAVVASALYLIYTYLIHPIFLSPLRDVPPAHPLARLTSLWIRYHRRNSVQVVAPIARAHAQHGPIVRLSPHEVSVSSYEAAHKIYIEKGGFTKPDWWGQNFATFDVRNMLSMRGGAEDKRHAIRKRDLGNVYTKSFLMGSEQMRKSAEMVMGRLCRELERIVGKDGKEEDGREGEKGIVDVYPFNGAMGSDFTSAYVFGPENGTNFIEDIRARDEYYRHHGTFNKHEPGDDKSQGWLETFAIRQRDRVSEKGEGSKDAVAYNQLSSRGISGNELAAELLDHFIAGAEGPRTVLTYLQWELCKRPEVQTRLRSEVRTLFPSSSDMDRLPDFKVLDALPFLDAVLTETLRVYSPTPGPQHRLTPPEGATIDGHFIPGGIPISAPFSVLHRNPDAFKEPDTWDPDRWLTQDNEKLEEMHHYFWAFNKGSRVCSGKDFIVIGMKLMIAEIYSRYETEIVEDDNMQQSDSLLAQPESEKLVLRFRRVG